MHALTIGSFGMSRPSQDGSNGGDSNAVGAIADCVCVRGRCDRCCSQSQLSTC